MPKDRSKTYSDHQSQAARLKKLLKAKAQPAEVQPNSGKPTGATGGTIAPSPAVPPKPPKKSSS